MPDLSFRCYVIKLSELSDFFVSFHIERNMIVLTISFIIKSFLIIFIKTVYAYEVYIYVYTDISIYLYVYINIISVYTYIYTDTVYVHTA